VNSGRYIVKEIRVLPEISGIISIFIIPWPVLTVIELVSVKSIISIESTVATLEALTVMVRMRLHPELLPQQYKLPRYLRPM
jgi:hypothetical protein